MESTLSSWSKFPEDKTSSSVSKAPYVWVVRILGWCKMVVCSVTGSTPRFLCLWHVGWGASGRAASDQKNGETTSWEKTPRRVTHLWCFSTKVCFCFVFLNDLYVECEWSSFICCAFHWQHLIHRPSPWSGGFSSRHGRWASHPQPSQTVILRGRPADYDHPPLLTPHQALHGRTHAHQWGI